ncbi:hypothetical protein IKP85_02960 [bacterium]|nr:hypothetical protein [bacterium]
MFPLISGLGALNVFDLRKSTPAANLSGNDNPFMKQAVASTSYTPNHPRHADSEGVNGVSPLARKLDFIS